ncbi:hypothetical protein G4X40_20290 [Rhodococcus sp. D2-41]|uniref:hypothetical protein n=1 Tax=Speluncibacter jeojiensis TaxID=2710754 RepID=UPI00240E9D42|nr:hypothetical protein [Rhodococcus sp. D2-41]MDG3012483.1 hypothetical protein [Rhodococcus sp. D2-41]
MADTTPPPDMFAVLCRAVDQIRTLHQPCAEGCEICHACGAPHPCPTTRILDTTKD